jgi:hypothetical protein
MNEEQENIKNLLDIVDQKYYEAKRNKISRLDPKWGEWSRRMNLFLRKKIDESGPNRTAYQYLFVYWLNRSQLLELYFKSTIGQMSKKSTLKKEAVQLKQHVLNPLNAPPLNDKVILKRITDNV